MKIGQTRQGVEIKLGPDKSLKTFLEEIRSLTNKDQLDVYCMVLWLTIRSKLTYGKNNDDYRWLSRALRGVEIILQKRNHTGDSHSLDLKAYRGLLTRGKELLAPTWRRMPI